MKGPRHLTPVIFLTLASSLSLASNRPPPDQGIKVSEGSYSSGGDPSRIGGSHDSNEAPPEMSSAFIRYFPFTTEAVSSPEIQSPEGVLSSNLTSEQISLIPSLIQGAVLLTAELEALHPLSEDLIIFVGTELQPLYLATQLLKITEAPESRSRYRHLNTIAGLSRSDSAQFIQQQGFTEQALHGKRVLLVLRSASYSSLETLRSAFPKAVRDRIEFLALGDASPAIPDRMQPPLTRITDTAFDSALVPAPPARSAVHSLFGDILRDQARLEISVASRALSVLNPLSFGFVTRTEGTDQVLQEGWEAFNTDRAGIARLATLIAKRREAQKLILSVVAQALRLDIHQTRATHLFETFNTIAGAMENYEEDPVTSHAELSIALDTEPTLTKLFILDVLDSDRTLLLDSPQLTEALIELNILKVPTNPTAEACDQNLAGRQDPHEEPKP